MAGNYIFLHSGHTADLMNMTADDINIEDIAWSLSRQCRYNGHSQGHLSVAEHSVWVSHAVPKRYALEGLLHDATEAYIGDMIWPLKQMMPDFVRFEERLWRVVAQRFDLPMRMSRAVQKADRHDSELEIEAGLIGGWSAEVAYREFMGRYERLVGVGE